MAIVGTIVGTLSLMFLMFLAGLIVGVVVTVRATKELLSKDRAKRARAAHLSN